MKKVDFTIKIEEKEYSKEELIKEVLLELEKLPDGKYEYRPIDPDNFHTKFSFQITKDK